MPPRCENRGMSLTVRTADLSRAARTSLNRFSSDELIYKTRQAAASCGFETRLAETALPAMVSPATTAMQIGVGALPLPPIGNLPIRSDLHTGSRALQSVGPGNCD